ncbi:unnamed protein product [Closterium sp. NIES-54]
MDGEDLRNGDDGGKDFAQHRGGVELNAGKARGLVSGEELESKGEREELEMSGADGEKKEEKNEEEEEAEEGQEEEEGEAEEEGEETEEDIIESLLREVDEWKGDESGQLEWQRGIDRRVREGTGVGRVRKQKVGKSSKLGTVREVMESRGVSGGVSGVPKEVRRGGRTARRRLVDGWMAGLPENTERTLIERPRARRGKGGRRRRRLVDGWVAGPQEKGESAFRWRNEVGDEEEMLTQHHDSYQWQWPVARLGDSWRGMFMREARYDIAVSA